MPPRYVFWTILVDNKPTAFRARDREELLPTFAQLRRRDQTAVIKWWAHGRLWDSPEHEKETQQLAEEKRQRERVRARTVYPDRRDRRAPRRPPLVQAFRPASQRDRRLLSDRPFKPSNNRALRVPTPAPVPPFPPGPDRPPKPDQEPPPGPFTPPERIEIIPEPPERAKRKP